MRVLALGMLELMLGVVWGLVWSLYSWSLVDSGFAGLSYGVLVLSMSLATLLGYMVCSLLYYLGSYKLVMPISATLIGLSYNSLRSGELLELAPIMMGFALGGHTVSTIRTSSLLSHGNPRFIAYVYSMSLLGFSLGSITVMSGYTLNPTITLLFSLTAGIAYQFIQKEVGTITVKPTLSRDLRVAFSSSTVFIAVGLILGLAGGLSFYNMDYYMIVLYGVSEKDVAFMLAVSGLLSAIISLAPLNISKGNLWRVHGVLTLVQALLLVTLILVQSLSYLVVVYAIRTIVAVLSDAVFDTLYTRAPPLRLADLRIPLILASWELSNGLGKLLGSTLVHANPVIVLVLASLLATLYSLVALAMKNPPTRRSGKLASTATSDTHPGVKLSSITRGYLKPRSDSQVVAPPRYKV